MEHAEGVGRFPRCRRPRVRWLGLLLRYGFLLLFLLLFLPSGAGVGGMGVSFVGRSRPASCAVRRRSFAARLALAPRPGEGMDPSTHRVASSARRPATADDPLRYSALSAAFSVSSLPANSLCEAANSRRDLVRRLRPQLDVPLVPPPESPRASGSGRRVAWRPRRRPAPLPRVACRVAPVRPWPSPPAASTSAADFPALQGCRQPLRPASIGQLLFGNLQLHQHAADDVHLEKVVRPHRRVGLNSPPCLPVPPPSADRSANLKARSRTRSPGRSPWPRPRRPPRSRSAAPSPWAASRRAALRNLPTSAACEWNRDRASSYALAQPVALVGQPRQIGEQDVGALAAYIFSIIWRFWFWASRLAGLDDLGVGGEGGLVRVVELFGDGGLRLLRFSAAAALRRCWSAAMSCFCWNQGADSWPEPSPPTSRP